MAAACYDDCQAVISVEWQEPHASAPTNFSGRAAERFAVRAIRATTNKTIASNATMPVVAAHKRLFDSIAGAFSFQELTLAYPRTG